MDYPQWEITFVGSLSVKSLFWSADDADIQDVLVGVFFAHYYYYYGERDAHTDTPCSATVV